MCPDNCFSMPCAGVCILTWLQFIVYVTYLLTYLLTSWSIVLFEKQISSQLFKNSPHFMELEGSLPTSLLPAPCPNPEAD